MDPPTVILIVILVLFTLALYFLWKPPARPLSPIPAVEIHDPQDSRLAKTKFPAMRYYDSSATK